VVSARTFGGQVALHNRVPLLRDPRQIGLLRNRMKADAEPDQVHLARDLAKLGHVSAHLGADCVDVSKRCTRKLELGSRFERDAGAPSPERDDWSARRFALRDPSVTLGERAQNPQHAVFALVLNRPPVERTQAELLGLSADQPLIAWFFRGAKRLEKLVRVAY